MGLAYFILQKEFPHFLCQICEQYEIGNWYGGIGGYNLYVCFRGTLRGNIIPGYTNIGSEIQDVIDRMAEWYLTQVISPKSNNYKKYLTNGISSTDRQSSGNG